GESDRENGPFPFTGAGRRYASFVHLNEIPDDRKAESKTAKGSFRCTVLLAEAREQKRQKLGTDSLAGVLHLNLNPLLILLELGPHGNLPPRRRKLDRVGEQIAEYLFHAAGIGNNRAVRRIEFGLNSDRLVFRATSDRIQSGDNAVFRIEFAKLQKHFSC